jgi:hypothetical protein
VFGVMPILLGAATAAAPAQDSTAWQGWPEVDVWVRPGSRIRLVMLASLTSQPPASFSYSEWEVGGGIDFTLKERLLGRLERVTRISKNVEHDRRQRASVRLGYRYDTVEKDGATRSHENRGVVDVTFRVDLPGAVLLADRTQLELRWIDDQYSTRVRNRVTLDRDAHLFHRTLTTYGSAELYYDSRYETTNRARFILGIQTHISRTAMIDAYFARQNDTRSQLSHINAVGMTLNLSY